MNYKLARVISTRSTAEALCKRSEEADRTKSICATHNRQIGDLSPFACVHTRVYVFDGPGSNFCSPGIALITPLYLVHQCPACVTSELARDRIDGHRGF